MNSEQFLMLGQNVSEESSRSCESRKGVKCHMSPVKRHAKRSCGISACGAQTALHQPPGNCRGEI